MKIEKQLNWLVGYKIEGKEYDDKKDRFSICAAFAYYDRVKHKTSRKEIFYESGNFNG